MNRCSIWLNCRMGMKCMRENNVHEAIAIEITTLLLLLMGMQSCNRPDEVEFLWLNPVVDSPYHFTIKSSEKHERRLRPLDQSTSFRLNFQAMQDSSYSFTFQFTFLDTALLRYFDEMDKQRNRIPDSSQLVLRKKYSQAFKEAEKDIFYGRVKTNGELLSIKGFEELRNRLSKLLQVDRRDVYSMLHEQAGDQEVERILNMVFMCVPGKTVNPGDTWIRNIMDNTRAPMKYSNLITFSERNNDTVQLKLQIAVSAKTGEEGTLYESGKGTGQMKVNARTGLPFDWSIEQETQYRTHYDTIIRKMITKGMKN